MRIRDVWINEVGPFDSVHWTLPEGRDPARADVHLLVGNNGSGKSTVLSALAQCFTVVNDTGARARMRGGESWAALASTRGERAISLVPRASIEIAGGPSILPCDEATGVVSM